MYDPVFVVAAAVFGAILGSFLNALSFRFNTGRSMGGRSRCMRCGHTLGALDLVPVLSYMFLGGKCRYCKTKVSLQYPLVELLAAVLSVGVYLLNPLPLTYALFLLVWLTILFIGVYDMRHTVIPWTFSISLMVLTFASLFVSGMPSLWSLLAGPLLALPLFLLSLFSRGTWMGWGDSAFELSLGWLLGIAAGTTALMLAVWSGAFVGLALLAVQYVSKKLAKTSSTGRAKNTFVLSSLGLTIKSEIPFAPFLAFGATLAYFFDGNFFSTVPLLF